jgi:hypothetical protein
MKKILTLVTLAASLLGGAVAQADRGTLPSVRKQIYANAKAQNALNGLNRPSLRLSYSGKKVTASIFAIGTGGMAGGKPHRMLQETATFKLGGLTLAGRKATAVREDGKVWQRIYYAIPYKGPLIN